MRSALLAALLILATLPAALAAPASAQEAEATPEALLTGITQIAASSEHNCARTETGRALCWGSNYDGEIGDGTLASGPHPPTTVLAPTGAGPLTGVAQVTAGWYHSCARLTNGQARCWGFGFDGQIGSGPADDDYQPRARVVSNPAGTGPLKEIRQLGAGERQTCAVLESRQLRCWGQNLYGELGIGTLGGNRYRPVTVRSVEGSGPLQGVAQVDGGFGFTCALLVNGEVRCWGRNNAGQLGNATGDPSSTLPRRVVRDGGGPLTGITQITAGDQHACARASDGRVWCWGSNEGDQLALGTDEASVASARLVRTSVSQVLTGVAQVDAGRLHTCFRLSSGQARCVGEGDRGQLGRNSSAPSEYPVTVVRPSSLAPLGGVTQVRLGIDHACALLTNHQVRCWGANAENQVGDGHPGTDRLRPRIVVT